MYRHLDVERILETTERLRRRIEERFPESNLRHVAAELVAVGEQARERIARVHRPHRGLRALIGVAIVLLVAALGGAVLLGIRLSRGTPDVTDFLQGLDAAVNEILLVSAAIYFLSSLERRLRRRKLLRALHELRSIAHVIDAHQLTKDPEAILDRGQATSSSPARQLDVHGLARYLDYCSELLSLTAKLAALHAQSDDDPVVLAAVNDVESLTGSLSNKIWQKVTILDTVRPWAGRP